LPLRLRWLGVTVIAAFSATAACEQALGIDGSIVVANRSDADGGPTDDGGTPETGPVACGLGAGSDTCAACVGARCCDQAHACSGDLTCSAYETCLLACGADYDCRSSCVAKHPAGSSPSVPPIDECVATYCFQECGITCGLAASYGGPDSGQACLNCVNATACMPARTCGTSVDCLIAVNCFLGCRTIDCQQACLAESDAGAAQLVATVGALGNCVPQCDVGNHWACVGSVGYPFAKTSQFEVAITAIDDIHQSPISGVVIKACDTGDVNCATPRATATTDPSGVARMTVPYISNVPFGFPGYFELSSSATVPYLYFLTAPLSEPKVSLTVILLSPTSQDTLASTGGVTVDPARGVIAAAAQDCWLSPASNVVLSAQGTDSQTQRRYYSRAMSALNPAAMSTDISGLAFFFNVPIGTQPITVTANPRSLGATSGRMGLFVRPGAISFANVTPTP
jgi:hypothetical protein